jgi:hypothetical protein
VKEKGSAASRRSRIVLSARHGFFGSDMPTINLPRGPMGISQSYRFVRLTPAPDHTKYLI